MDSLEHLATQSHGARVSLFDVSNAYKSTTFRAVNRNLEPQSRSDSAKVSFVDDEGKCLTTWKTIHREETLKVGSLCEKFRSVAVFLCHGGYFAGGFFEGGKCVAHKTFRRYVTRKGQGRRQCNHDKHSVTGKSAGSQIRRYNEGKHQDEIHELLQDWSEYLSRATLIFHHAPGENKKFFFGDEGFRKDDERVLQIPMTTNRPSYTEVTRVWEELTCLILNQIPKEEMEEVAVVPEKVKPQESSFSNPPPARGNPIVMPRPRARGQKNWREEEEVFSDDEG